MDSAFGDMFNAIFGITIVGIIATLAVPIIIIAVVVWAIRRNGVLARDPAEEELRGRLARGEIDMAEFEVRLRALRHGDAS
jgi:uncharacterized membrane protein